MLSCACALAAMMIPTRKAVTVAMIPAYFFMFLLLTSEVSFLIRAVLGFRLSKLVVLSIRFNNHSQIVCVPPIQTEPIDIYSIVLLADPSA